MDTLAWLGDDGGHEVFTAWRRRRSGGGRNRRGRGGERARRGGMEEACSRASPGARRRHGEAWKVLGGDVASTAGSVAFHQAAWRRGARKKTPLTLVGRVGWMGRSRLGDR